MISPDHLPLVKYDHSRKTLLRGDAEQYYTQEDARKVASEIDAYNDDLPDVEYVEDQIEKVVQKYSEDTVSAYDSFN